MSIGVVSIAVMSTGVVSIGVMSLSEAGLGAKPVGVQAKGPALPAEVTGRLGNQGELGEQTGAISAQAAGKTAQALEPRGPRWPLCHLTEHC